MTRVSDTGEGSSWVWWGVAAGAGCVVIRVLVQLMSDVLSATGLLYSLGLGSAEGIAFPLATRLVTWFGLLELCALAGMIGNYWVGRWKDHWAANLLLGHVAFVGWIFRGLQAGGRGIAAVTAAVARARRGRVEVLVDVGQEDFDALVVKPEVA